MRVMAHLLPGINTRASLAFIRSRGWYREQSPYDPAAGFQGIDHVINFQIRGHVEGLSLLIGSIDHCLKGGLLLVWIADCCQFFAIPKANRTFESHCAKFAAGPGHRKEWGVEAPTSHRLSPETVAFSQDNTEEGDAEATGGHKHAADMTNGRGLLGFWPDYKAGSVAKREDRQAKGIA